MSVAVSAQPTENQAGTTVPSSSASSPYLAYPDPAATASAGAVAKKFFEGIDSTQFVQVAVERPIRGRADFMAMQVPTLPPITGKSDFVSRDMVEHLMRNKGGGAHLPKRRITLMEGAYHTFVTSVGLVRLTKDCQHPERLGMEHPFMGNRTRPVLMSFATHPDFSDEDVMFQVVALKDEAVEGEVLADETVPRAFESRAKHSEYETKLLKHMVYHLTQDHRLPARKDVSDGQVMDPDEAKAFLEAVISDDTADKTLKGKFVAVNDAVISLEVLARAYFEQVRNEFKVIDPNTPQGYVYTIQPPSIFAAALGGATLLNRLQALAFQVLKSQGFFTNLKMIGFNDYDDKKMIELFQRALSSSPTQTGIVVNADGTVGVAVAPAEIKVVSYWELYHQKGYYKGPAGQALVLHNNGNEFDQHIEVQGPRTMDGVMGSYSDAALVVKRDRPDLAKHVI